MRLVLIVPPTGKVAKIQRVVLEEGETVDIGGASDCRAVLDDPSIGTARLRLERRGTEWTVQDLEGLGKCVVGGVRLGARARRILRPPLSLWLGDVECRMDLDLALHEDQPTRELALRMVKDVDDVVADAPVVRIAEGNRMGDAITLARDEPRLIGRGKDVALFLEDTDVSRHHLSVAWRGDRVIVTDLGSAGGTYLGKARLEPNRAAVWSPARMLVAGKTVLLLEATKRELLSEIARIARTIPAADGSSTPLTDPAEPPTSTTTTLPEESSKDSLPPHEPLAGPTSAAGVVALPPARVCSAHADTRGRIVTWATVAFIVVAVVILTTTGWVLVSAH